MNLQSAVELILAVAALSLLARDLRRAWLDGLRRPVTIVIATLMVALLVGSVGGRTYPSPWWLALPAVVLGWEVGRGWRRTPRCHLWEAGVGAFAASLVLAGAGLGLGDGTIAGGTLAAAAAAAVLGVALLWRSHAREPRPWRLDDVAHYERRSAQRPKS